MVYYNYTLKERFKMIDKIVEQINGLNIKDTRTGETLSLAYGDKILELTPDNRELIVEYSALGFPKVFKIRKNKGEQVRKLWLGE